MITIHEADSLAVEVPVTFDEGGAVTSLVGASVAASVAKGSTTVPGTAAVAGPALATCSWPAGALAVGIWRFQLIVTIGGEVQTIAEERIKVLPSN